MKHTRTLSLLLAALLAASALAACQQQPQTDWREDVTNVLSAQTTTTKKPASVITPSTTTVPPTDETTAPPGSFVIPEGYVSGQPHPLVNPDAGALPSISYGRDYILYQDYFYYPKSTLQGEYILVYNKLSDLLTGDLMVTYYQGAHPTPNSTPVCNDPFCGHQSYDVNNGVICPLYFGVHRGEGNWQKTYYCLDYGESNGSTPVFYICAAEPEYTVVGEQVIEIESKDAAIYRYESATGKRTLLTQDLPEIYFFAQSGDYLYYTSYDGLTVLDKTGKERGRYNDGDTLFQILNVIDDTLYITDHYGNLYTSDRLLANVEKIYTHEFDTTGLDADYVGVVLGDTNCIPPFGYTVSDRYLYYCDDFKVEFETEYKKEYSSSIYRLSLDDPDATPELLAQNNSGEQILGVVNGKVYYEPYQLVGGSDRYYEHNLNCVDAVTKEITAVIDNGYDSPSSLSVLPILNEKFIIARSSTMIGGVILIYDLETGDYCYLYADS